jgi:hypothetical protein
VLIVNQKPSETESAITIGSADRGSEDGPMPPVKAFHMRWTDRIEQLWIWRGLCKRSHALPPDFVVSHYRPCDVAVVNVAQGFGLSPIAWWALA